MIAAESLSLIVTTTSDGSTVVAAATHCRASALLRQPFGPVASSSSAALTVTTCGIFQLPRVNASDVGLTSKD